MKIILNLIALLLLAYLIYKILERRNEKEQQRLEQEILSRESIIDQYRKTIKEKKNINVEDAIKVGLLQNEIEVLKDKYSSLRIEYEIKDNLLIKEQKKNIQLQEKVKDKEHQRRLNASAIGGKQKKISQLEQEIENLKEIHRREIELRDRKIEFYKSKIEPPTLEEIKAYENGNKEVLKRMKDGK